MTFAGFPGSALSIRSLFAMPANVTHPPARVNPVSFSGLPRCHLFMHLNPTPQHYLTQILPSICLYVFFPIPLTRLPPKAFIRR